MAKAVFDDYVSKSEVVENQPIKIIKNYNLMPVLGDGNCLISSVILGYLGETENNLKGFLERSKELFPNMDEERYNWLFANFESLKNPNNIKLLKSFILEFRKNLSDYIRKNLNKKFSNGMTFLSLITNEIMERKQNCELELAELLNLESDNEERISDLRKEQTALEELMTKPAEEQARVYLNKLEQDGTWCTNLEIAAICNLVQCKISLKNITEENNQIKILDIPSIPIDENIKVKSEIKLCFKVEEQHYSYFQIDPIWQKEQINSFRSELNQVYNSKKADSTFISSSLLSEEEKISIQQIQEDKLTKLIETNTPMENIKKEVNNDINENQESLTSEQKLLLEEFYANDERLAWDLQLEEFNDEDYKYAKSQKEYAEALEEAYACSQ